MKLVLDPRPLEDCLVYLANPMTDTSGKYDKCGKCNTVTRLYASLNGKHKWCGKCVAEHKTQVIIQSAAKAKMRDTAVIRNCEECDLDIETNALDQETVHAECAAAFCAECGIFLFDTVKAVGGLGALCDDCERSALEIKS